MNSDIYWIPTQFEGRIGIMPCLWGSKGLEDEIGAWRDSGADLVVSLLELAEARELGLEAEESLCLRAGLDFISFPIPDRGIPDERSEVVKLVERLRSSVLSGHGVAIHCLGGIGRSAMVAAIVLLSLGAEADNVFELISEARGCEVPGTPDQAEYALTFYSSPGRHPLLK